MDRGGGNLQDGFDFTYRLNLYQLLTEQDLRKLDKKVIELTFFRRTMNAKGLFHFAFYMYDRTVHFYVNEKNFRFEIQVVLIGKGEQLEDSALLIANKVRKILQKRVQKVPQLIFLPQSKEISISLIVN